MSMHLKRYLYAYSGQIRLDRDGLFDEKYSSRSEKIISDEELLNAEGAIIVAEGGMGKTELSAWMENRLGKSSCLRLPLGDCQYSSTELRETVNAFLNTAPKGAVVIFDALDELDSLAESVLLLMRDGGARYFVMTRWWSQLDAFKERLPAVKLLTLAPLSFSAVQSAATGIEVDAEAFMRDVRRQGMGPLCAKPFGCRFLLQSYQSSPRDFSAVSAIALWKEGIKQISEEQDSCGRRNLGTSKFSVDQMYAAAKWIAVNMVVGNMGWVYVGERRRMPLGKRCLYCGDMECEEKNISFQLLASTLKSGLFTVVPDGTSRFMHSAVFSFLAAEGMNEWMDAANYHIFLEYPDGRIYSNRAEIAGWLAAFNEEWRARLADREPEVLLCCAEAVHELGELPLVKALIKDARGIESRRMGREGLLYSASQGFFRLAGNESERYLNEVVHDKALDDAQRKLALWILSCCESPLAAPGVIDVLIDVKESLKLRQSAAHRLRFVTVSQSEMCRLRIAQRRQSFWRGDDGWIREFVLSVLWPNFIGFEEFLRILRIKGRDVVRIGSLVDGLYDSLAVKYKKSHAKHAMEYVVSSYRCDPRLPHPFAQRLLALTWKWAGDGGEIDNMFAKVAGLQKKADSSLVLPFPQRYSWRKGDVYLAKEDFVANQRGRLSVLHFLLEDRAIPVKDIALTHYGEYPFYSQADVEQLLDMICRDARKPYLQQRIAYCVKTVLRDGELSRCRREFSRVAKLFPELKMSPRELSDYLLRKNKQEAELSRAELARRRRMEGEEAACKFCDEHEYRRILRSKINDRRKVEEALQALLGDQRREYREPNLRKSNRWTWVEENGCERFVGGLRWYCENYNRRYRNVKNGYLEPMAAVATLMALDPEFFDGLSIEKLNNLVPFLLHHAYDHGNESVQSVLRLVVSRCEEVTGAVLVRSVRSGKFLDITKKWASELSGEQTKRCLLELIKDRKLIDFGDCYVRLFKIGSRLECVSFLPTLIKLGKIMSKDVNVVSKVFAALIFVAPAEYMDRFVKSHVNDPLLIRIVMFHLSVYFDDCRDDWFARCDGEALARLSIELRKTYELPDGVDRGRVNYAVLSISDGAVEKMRMRKCKKAVQGLKLLASQYADDIIIRDAYERARVDEWESVMLALERTDLQKMLAGPDLALAIRTSKDLLDSVKFALKDYQQYLSQGSRAVHDLWDMKPRKQSDTRDYIAPKREEMISDHIERYLKLRLPGMIVGREVQISRKYNRRAVAPGARTDITIWDDNGESPLKLIVEVKGNWNSSKTEAIDKQLIGNYLTLEPEAAGLYVLAWFESLDWDGRMDSRKSKHKSIWRTRKIAEGELKKQVERSSGNHVIDSLVLDCTC